ncbi:hypothetical protein SFC79_09010 [Nocardioides sp. S-58]|uniref:Membrane protein YfhO n=1 Tax=Nocardioides renjunii TaxID=3095075 RepID=A0ABU5KAL8_9ACTN|nr:hypothetical protein [Nocardioides sp. S-58]MDZ5661898.1 hypothetical protein [Nocardioides sp. S-58]
MRRRTSEGALRAAPVLWSLLLAVVLLGGALGPGFVLTYDMVWVPDLSVRPDFLGLGSGLPRAVPSDLVVALLDEVVPGMLLQKAALLLSLVLAGVGAWRLLPPGNWVASVAAATVYVWNPFVVERLGIGHWPLLMTYAALPWILRAARGWGAGERTSAGVVLWVAVGSLSPVGGILAAVFALLCVAAPRAGARRRLLWTGCAAAALNAPWIVAGALHASNAVSDPVGVEVFAARGEGGAPTLVSLLGLGGIWNADVVPVSRTTWAGVVAVLLVLVVCAAGVRAWRRSSPRGEVVALTTAGVVGLLVALAGSVAPGAVEWLVAHVPGGGLVRDGSRFVALLAPLQAILFGFGVARIAAAVPARQLGATVATGLVLAPLALMPDAAWGLSGQLRAVSYPDELAEARAAMQEERAAGAAGDLLSLPFTSYRRPGWNHGRRVLDPVGRWFPVDYLASDTLVVSGRVVGGEDERAARVADLLGTLTGAELTQALRDEGIGWVVVDREATRAVAAETGEEPPDVAGAVEVHGGRLYTLSRLGPGDVADPEPPGGRRLAYALLALAWASAAAAVVLAAARLVLVRTGRGEMRRRR